VWDGTVPVLCWPTPTLATLDLSTGTRPTGSGPQSADLSPAESECHKCRCRHTGQAGRRAHSAGRQINGVAADGPIVPTFKFGRASQLVTHHRRHPAARQLGKAGVEFADLQHQPASVFSQTTHSKPKKRRIAASRQAAAPLSVSPARRVPRASTRPNPLTCRGRHGRVGRPAGPGPRPARLRRRAVPVPRRRLRIGLVPGHDGRRAAPAEVRRWAKTGLPARPLGPRYLFPAVQVGDVWRTTVSWCRTWVRYLAAVRAADRLPQDRPSWATVDTAACAAKAL
jgi:hypothetical protein